MTDARNGIPSVLERTRPVKAAAAVVGAHFLGDTAVLVLGEQSLLLVPRQGEPRPVAVHAGAILASAADDGRVITGGDDGRVVLTKADGSCITAASDAKRRWIDHVAAGRQHAIAWSAGKQAFVRLATGEERTLQAPSTVGGLAFAPKGLRVAVAHYNAVFLWFPNAQPEPETLPWNGSHLDVLFSPDARFLVTSMQEPVLHGWRLSDNKDMQMSGYARRVRSMGFSADGRWLVTSGANRLILWPFQGREGPMGKAPDTLAPAECEVDVVACHPKQNVVAAGYRDGCVLLVRLHDGALVLAKQPGPAPVTALAFSASGVALAFGTEEGEAGIIDLA